MSCSMEISVLTMGDNTSVCILRRWFNEYFEVQTKGIGFERKNIHEINLFKSIFAFYFSFT